MKRLTNILVRFKHWILSIVMFSFKTAVKFVVLKPLVELSYIINGKAMGEIKWYQKKYNGVIKWKWLNNSTYKLTKWVMFY